MTGPSSTDDSPRTTDLEPTAETDAVHRARLYTLLSLSFDSPGEPLERALADGAIPDGLVASARALEDDGVATAAEDLQTLEGSLDVDRFRSAYGSLFGVESGTTVSPYEVGYRAGGLVTNTDELADVAGFYGAFGLEVGERRDRVDYLPTELEFAGELAAREAYLAESGDDEGVAVVVDAQRAFLEDHLGRWIPRLRAAIEDAADDDLYPALAGLLKALVDAEADRLGAEPNVLEAEPDGPLESVFEDGDGDWRCGTCVGNPSAGGGGMPMGGPGRQ